MASFRAALRLRLIGDAAVRAIVGQRVRWVMVPAGDALPYIRLQVISDPRPDDLEDYDATRITRVQCDCFAATAEDAEALSEAVIAALNAPATVGGIAFGRIHADGPRDLGEDTPDGFVHRASIDLLAEHSPA